MTNQTTTNQTATLVPPTGLVTTNSNGKTLFALFTQDWITLLAYIVQTLALPITQGGFTDKYGTFSDESEIENVITAMKDLNTLSATFGDPATLSHQLASDPSILQTDTAPTEIYTHIVWFATKLHEVASTHNQTLDSIVERLKPSVCGTQQQCASVFRQILTGKDGLQSTAEDMLTKANALVQVMAQFNESLEPSAKAMAKYTTESSQFYQYVENAISVDSQNINTYTATAYTAHQKWIDDTIAAVSSSISVLVLSCGLAWPVSVGLGIGLGVAAGNARNAYEQVETLLKAANTDDQKKMHLKHDLQALNDNLIPSSNAAKNLENKLIDIAEVLSTISDHIAYIADNFTDEKLGDPSWVEQVLEVHEATLDWQTIAKATDDYTTNSLVSFSTQVFGTKLPPVQSS